MRASLRGIHPRIEGNPALLRELENLRLSGGIYLPWQPLFSYAGHIGPISFVILMRA